MAEGTEQSYCWLESYLLQLGWNGLFREQVAGSDSLLLHSGMPEQLLNEQEIESEMSEVATSPNCTIIDSLKMQHTPATSEEESIQSTIAIDKSETITIVSSIPSLQVPASNIVEMEGQKLQIEGRKKRKCRRSNFSPPELEQIQSKLKIVPYRTRFMRNAKPYDSLCHNFTYK